MPRTSARSGAAPQSLSQDAVFGSLKSSRRGLTVSEARVRLTSSGANVLPSVNRRSLASELAAQFQNMFV
ncbi:MAG TPA: cation-transporting P-type ATPase, partial [Candidatus Nanopelagicaceae bacterium]|nr:cation-transporting P-type ATPase [Candidatus Nanopelagicaceae bacterium]